MSSSNVGNAQVYEAGDQRNPPDSEKAENQAQRHEEGKKGSHEANDPSKSELIEQSIVHVLTVWFRGREIHCQQTRCCQTSER